MKKLLGLLGAMGLTASSVATGVAMSPVQTVKDVEVVTMENNEVETLVSVSPYASVWINPTNCGILKNWSEDARWRWAINSGYPKAAADAISVVPREVWAWGESSGQGHTVHY